MNRAFLTAAVVGLIAMLGHANSWYQLDSNQTYVTDFSLQPGEVRDFDLAAAQPLMVGLQTDATQELKRAPGKNYARLTQRGTFNDVATLIGASRQFEPVNGKLDFSVKNETSVTLKVVIYKSAPRPSK